MLEPTLAELEDFALATRTPIRFACAVTLSTFEGRTLYRDALRMLWLRRMSDFQDLAMRLGVTESRPQPQVPPTLVSMTTRKGAK